MKKNLISIRTLEAQGLEFSSKVGVLKMLKGSMVVLKSARHNNLYYLKGYTVIGQLETSVGSDEDSTRLQHIRLGHTDEKNQQVFAKKELLKGAKICKLEFYEHCIIGNKTKVKCGIAIHCTEEIFNYVHMNVWGPTKTTSLGSMHFFVSLVDDFSLRCSVYTMRYKGKLLNLFLEWKK